MHDEKHDLIRELPEYKEKIHEMKESNAHFRKIFDEYHVLTKDIRHLESQDIPVTDAHFEELKKKRLHYKDELFTMLNAA
ncbi:MAG: DUF465 domain-containing protein [Alphaproteobacteria bacterium]|nr:DUF465 domain-containing protein [Alphaproteobacteria bacterium]NCQ67020.1 DUF465 domain-containing protein [Alphaproteobacteria bacterium]NCT07617.1 DUF465 domain-containing protein [Alphaproteobacteria bacterium]